MTILINDKTRGDNVTYFNATCGKTSAHVSIYTDGRVGVCVLNASHRAWKRMGKYFASLDLALQNYKSEAVRQILFPVSAEAAS